MLTLCLHRRAQNHIRHLLELIDQFPRVNPSAAAATAAGEAAASNSEVDIPRLFRQIRSRYKVLCASLGVRPTLRAADGAPASPDRPLSDDRGDVAIDGAGGVGSGVEISSTSATSGAGTGTGRPARKNVWAVQDARGAGASAELSF